MGRECENRFWSISSRKNASVHVKPRLSRPRPPPFHDTRFVQCNAAAKRRTFRDNVPAVPWLCALHGIPCVQSIMTDHRAVCTQDAIQPTAVGACAADVPASQATGRQQDGGVLQ